jgi:hypothetical protein
MKVIWKFVDLRCGKYANLNNYLSLKIQLNYKKSFGRKTLVG